MALQQEIYLSGKIGNIVFYKMNGKHYGRMAPEKVTQTKAMKAHANQFGRASRIARVVRELLNAVIPFPADNKMQTRLVSAILAWLKNSGDSREKRIQNLYPIKQFKFTTEGPDFLTRWKPGLEINHSSADLLEITIPAFIPIESITAPKHTASVKLKLSAGSVNPENGGRVGSSSVELLFNYDNIAVAEQTVSLKFPMPEGSLVITGAYLEYTIMENLNPVLNKNKSYMPSAIIGAMYI
jgi:hypothetical protein